MSLRELLRRGWYMSVDGDGAGGGGEGDGDEGGEGAGGEGGQGPGDGSGGEGDGGAAGEGDGTGDGGEGGEGGQGGQPPAAAPRELTDAEIEAEAVKRGFVKPTPPPAPDHDPTKPPPVPSFRKDAFAEAKQYPAFVDHEGNLTNEGVEWAEERAIQKHAEHVTSGATEAQQRQQLIQSRDTIASGQASMYKDQGFDDDLAQAAGGHYADILAEIGPIVLEPAPLPHDPPQVRQQRELAQMLRNDAYDRALGRAVREKTKGGGSAGGDPPARDARKPNNPPVDGGGGGDNNNGSLYTRAKAKDENKTFLEDFEKSRGRKPTQAEMADFVKQKVVVV